MSDVSAVVGGDEIFERRDIVAETPGGEEEGVEGGVEVDGGGVEGVGE